MDLRLILKTLQKTLSSTGIEKGNSTDQNNVKQTQVRTLPQYSFKADVQQNLKAQMLNRAEQALLMKDLLNIPKELKDLLVLLTNPKSSPQNILQLLQAQNQKINPEIIRQFLESNSKEVINKLIKIIQQSPDNRQNHELLKQLINLMNQAIPHKSSSQEQVIMHLLLLYLPWLPLFEQQKIEVWFKKKKQGGSDEEKEAMVIYISTINLGRFKVSIIIDQNNNLEIYIENINEDNQIENSEERRELLKNILKQIKSDIKDEKIKAKTKLSITKQANYEGTEQQEVTVAKVNDISPAVLVAAQKITQVIFEMDEKLSLREKRRIEVTGQ